MAGIYVGMVVGKQEVRIYTQYLLLIQIPLQCLPTSKLAGLQKFPRLRISLKRPYPEVRVLCMIEKIALLEKDGVLEQDAGVLPTRGNRARVVHIRL